jgi:hypothetical protein
MNGGRRTHCKRSRACRNSSWCSPNWLLYHSRWLKVIKRFQTNSIYKCKSGCTLNKTGRLGQFRIRHRTRTSSGLVCHSKSFKRSIAVYLSTRDAAVFDPNQRLDDPRKHLKDPPEDLSISTSDSEREYAVLQVFGAMKDTSCAKDATSTDFNLRWVHGSEKQYKGNTLAATAWEIVALMERLHREGPSALSIRDPNNFPTITASAHLTFKERLTFIATLCSEWKARDNALFKGTTLETTVATPLEAL